MLIQHYHEISNMCVNLMIHSNHFMKLKILKSLFFLYNHQQSEILYM
jgi:hypothetical protein